VARRSARLARGKRLRARRAIGASICIATSSAAALLKGATTRAAAAILRRLRSCWTIACRRADAAACCRRRCCRRSSLLDLLAKRGRRCDGSWRALRGKTLGNGGSHSGCRLLLLLLLLAKLQLPKLLLPLQLKLLLLLPKRSRGSLSLKLLLLLQHSQRALSLRHAMAKLLLLLKLLSLLKQLLLLQLQLQLLLNTLTLLFSFNQLLTLLPVLLLDKFALTLLTFGHHRFAKQNLFEQRKKLMFLGAKQLMTFSLPAKTLAKLGQPCPSTFGLICIFIASLSFELLLFFCTFFGQLFRFLSTLCGVAGALGALVCLHLAPTFDAILPPRFQQLRNSNRLLRLPLLFYCYQRTKYTTLCL
jgi:hypothetical protein